MKKFKINIKKNQIIYNNLNKSNKKLLKKIKLINHI